LLIFLVVPALVIAIIVIWFFAYEKHETHNFSVSLSLSDIEGSGRKGGLEVEISYFASSQDSSHTIYIATLDRHVKRCLFTGCHFVHVDIMPFN
jgi:hypothetical protein